MKILHVYHLLAPRAGGVVSVVQQLACAQAQAGHEVEVFTTDLDYPSGVLPASQYSQLTNSGVKVRCFSTEYREFALSRSLWRALAREMQHFDIVHIHGLYRFPQFAAGVIARNRGVPYLVQVHGTLDSVVHARSAKSLALKRLYERCVGIPLVRRANAVYYTCRAEQRRGRELQLNRHDFVLPNGIDWRRFERLPKLGLFRQRHNLGTAPIVLFVGRINFKKGLDLLIAAMSAVVGIYPQAQLVLAGPENDNFAQTVRGWVSKHNIQRNVVFTGMLDESQVMEAYTDANVFALPSYGENFGMSVVEAMACGCPVVISDKVGIHDEVADARAGIVVPCAKKPLARAICQLLDDTTQAKSLGQSGRQLARERFDIAKVSAALIGEYHALIARHSCVQRQFNKPADMS